MKHLSILSLLLSSILFVSCSKDEDNGSSGSNGGGDNNSIEQGIAATVNGENVSATYHCPGEDGAENCNVRNESTGLVRLKMTVSEENQTGWNIEFFIDDLETATFPIEIEEMDGSNDDIPLNFRYFVGSWSGSNEYRYQNFPGSEGELSFTILDLSESTIVGEFSGEIQKLSNPNETATFEDGQFELELHYQ